MKKILSVILIFGSLITTAFAVNPPRPVRILVITGGHDYNKEKFNAMLSSLAPEVSWEIAELPQAFEMFAPANRGKYDVLVFYHMWQDITDRQKEELSECISGGKPVVALHHSICAFDNWPGYWDIIGGKYFHKPTTYKGREYQACSYIHDLHFNVRIADSNHPVTRGVTDFEIFDETYKGYYVEDGVKPLLTTSEPSSTPVIGWTKMYGKAKIVVLQSGHDVPTFENPSFRKLLLQSIEWVSQE
jgi:type 1 glutamine amidotransferase